MIEYIRLRYKRVSRMVKRSGLRGITQKVFNQGVLKPTRNYLSYRRKREQYPSNVIFVAGLPKSGSTWFAKMCASLDGFDKFTPLRWGTDLPDSWEPTCDLYEGVFEEFKNRLAVVKGHTYGTEENVDFLRRAGIRYLLTVRDPRDQIISAYWYLKKSPIHWDWQLVNRLTLSEFITHKLQSGEFEQNIVDWCRSWLDHRDENASMLVRYEDLLEDTKAVMSEVFRHLGIARSEEEVERIVETNSFKRVSGRTPGQQDTGSFLRKGVSGEWREIFTDEQKELFAKIGEDVVMRLGYEPTLDSVRHAG
jgi:hypothetical protein